VIEVALPEEEEIYIFCGCRHATLAGSKSKRPKTYAIRQPNKPINHMDRYHDRPTTDRTSRNTSHLFDQSTGKVALIGGVYASEAYI
jgi:hypothetical protein